MKMSLSQMIAIVCVLAVGFAPVAPFTPDADAWPHHECCSTVLVWKQIGTWGSIKAGTYTPVYGYVPETRCDQGFWHWKVWPHSDPCSD